MRIRWSDDAFSDLDRIFDSIATNNPAAAERTVKMLLSAPSVLAANPQIGPRIENLETADVRRLVVGAYEVRYRLTGQTVEILRIFHTKEDR